MTPAERRIMNNAVYAQQLGSTSTKANFKKKHGVTPTQYIKNMQKK